MLLEGGLLQGWIGELVCERECVWDGREGDERLEFNGKTLNEKGKEGRVQWKGIDVGLCRPLRWSGLHFLAASTNSPGSHIDKEGKMV